jgi:hypothetical protein
MSGALRRIAAIVWALIGVSGVFGTANAQVVIHIVTAQQTTCDVTTDANGVSLVPGGTDLMVTGATLSGTGCGGGSGPPAPNNFPLTVSAAPVTGTPFTVSWSVTGATSCTGSASLNGSATTLSGWTDVTSASSPRNVVATAAGAYTISLTCSNTGGSVTSLPAIVVVAQGTGSGCPSSPRSLATVSDIHYLPDPHVRHSVDLTLWDNIWGHINENDDVTPWPGVAGASPTIWTLGKNQYIGALFHVGDIPPTSSLSGFFKNVSYGAGPNLDMAISQTCGDFAPAQPGCSVSDIPAADRPLVYWRMTDGGTSFCQLTANTDYYLNVQFHDPNTTGPGCGGSTCETTIQHYHN